MVKRVLIILYYFWTTSLFGMDTVEAVKKPITLSPEEYLKTHSIEEISKIERYRIELNGEQQDAGNNFVISLFESQLKTIDLNNINEIRDLIKLGEVLSASEEYMHDSIWIYLAASDMIFGNISKTLQKSIDEEQIDLDEFDTKYIIQSLVDNKYAVNVPVSNWIKLYGYVRDGRWGYIWHKFTSTYKKEFGIALISGLLFSWTCFGLYRFRKRKKQIQID